MEGMGLGACNEVGGKGKVPLVPLLQGPALLMQPHLTCETGPSSPSVGRDYLGRGEQGKDPQLLVHSPEGLLDPALSEWKSVYPALNLSGTTQEEGYFYGLFLFWFFTYSLLFSLIGTFHIVFPSFTVTPPQPCEVV